MAIVVEERSPTNWAGILLALVVIALLFGGGYFLFFKKPQLIEVVLPPELVSLRPLTEAPFDPQEVISSPNFKALKDYSGELTLPFAGRDNPFKPF